MSLSTITTQAVVVRAAASCDENYYGSVAVNYCSTALVGLPTCTVDTPVCCASYSSFASKAYMCISKYATECGPAKTNYLENLGVQAKACTWFGGPGTATALIVTNLPTETASGNSPTATAGAGSGTTSAKATGSPNATGTQSVAGQSSGAVVSAAATTKSSSASRMNGGLGTMGVVGLVGGIAMFFLSGGL